jgi:hypothetical protein
MSHSIEILRTQKSPIKGAVGDADEELPSEIPDVVRKDMVTRLKRAAP